MEKAVNIKPCKAKVLKFITHIRSKLLLRPKSYEATAVPSEIRLTRSEWILRIGTIGFTESVCNAMSPPNRRGLTQDTASDVSNRRAAIKCGSRYPYIREQRALARKRNDIHYARIGRPILRPRLLSSYSSSGREPRNSVIAPLACISSSTPVFFFRARFFWYSNLPVVRSPRASLCQSDHFLDVKKVIVGISN